MLLPKHLKLNQSQYVFLRARTQSNSDYLRESTCGMKHQSSFVLEALVYGSLPLPVLSTSAYLQLAQLSQRSLVQYGYSLATNFYEPIQLHSVECGRHGLTVDTDSFP